MSKQDKNDDWYLQYNYDRWQRLKRHPDYRKFCKKHKDYFDWIDGIGFVGFKFTHDEIAAAALAEIKEQFGLSNVYHCDFDEDVAHPLSLLPIFKDDLFVNPIGLMVKAKNATSKQSTIRDNHCIDSSTINLYDPDGDNFVVNQINLTSATLKPSIVRDGHYIDCRINIAPEIPIEQIQESIKRWVKYARSEISTENSRSRFQENLIAYKVYDLRLDREPYDSIRKKLNITEEIARQKFRRAWKLILNEEFNTEKLKQLIEQYFAEQKKWERFEELDTKLKEKHVFENEEKRHPLIDNYTGTTGSISDVRSFCNNCLDKECSTAMLKVYDELNGPSSPNLIGIEPCQEVIELLQAYASNSSGKRFLA